MKFITPAIASEPYCADAPSRRISRRFTAILGIMPTSTAWAPTFMAAPKCDINAERWRRFELVSTRTLSGGRPRIDVGLTKAAPSPVRGVALKDGT